MNIELVLCCVVNKIYVEDEVVARKCIFGKQ